MQGTLKNLVLFMRKRNNEYEFYVGIYTQFFYHIALQLILSSSEVVVCRSSRKADAASRALTVILRIL